MGNVRNLRPFRPGKSGNPKGRPRGRGLNALLRDLISMSSLNGKELPDGKTVAMLLAEQLIAAALGGSIAAIKIIQWRTEGPPQAGGYHDPVDDDVESLREHLRVNVPRPRTRNGKPSE